MRVLVVEDVEFMAKMAQKLLSMANIESDVAMLPQAAKDLVNSNEYDGILMDFGLPDMSGLDLTRLLRESGFDKPIIGLTANPDEYTLEDMQAAGLNACLSKPLTLDDVALLSIDASLGWVDNGRGDDE